MVQNHVYRVQRGWILKSLYKSFPTGVNSDVISLTLAEMRLSLTGGTLRGHCDYLEGKGYVEIKKEADRSDNVFFTKITPKGIDLIEETIPADPGVKL